MFLHACLQICFSFSAASCPLNPNSYVHGCLNCQNKGCLRQNKNVKFSWSKRNRCFRVKISPQDQTVVFGSGSTWPKSQIYARPAFLSSGAISAPFVPTRWERRIPHSNIRGLVPKLHTGGWWWEGEERESIVTSEGQNVCFWLSTQCPWSHRSGNTERKKHLFSQWCRRLDFVFRRGGVEAQTSALRGWFWGANSLPIAAEGHRMVVNWSHWPQDTVQLRDEFAEQWFTFLSLVILQISVHNGHQMLVCLGIFWLWGCWDYRQSFR